MSFSLTTVFHLSMVLQSSLNLEQFAYLTSKRGAEWADWFWRTSQLSRIEARLLWIQPQGHLQSMANELHLPFKLTVCFCIFMCVTNFTSTRRCSHILCVVNTVLYIAGKCQSPTTKVNVQIPFMQELHSTPTHSTQVLLRRK